MQIADWMRRGYVPADMRMSKEPWRNVMYYVEEGRKDRAAYLSGNRYAQSIAGDDVRRLIGLYLIAADSREMNYELQWKNLLSIIKPFAWVK